MALSIPTDDDLSFEKETPPVTSFKDLQIIEGWDPETNKFMYLIFFITLLPTTRSTSGSRPREESLLPNIGPH